MAKTKKSRSPEQEAVAAAEAAVAAKAAELEAAQAAVRLLKFELDEARSALTDAREAADELLPQCVMVQEQWRSGATEEIGRFVVVRKTPGGMLIVRHVGSTPDAEMRFKWSAHRGVFVSAEKTSTWHSTTRKLRDVPPEFLPAVPSPA